MIASARPRSILSKTGTSPGGAERQRPYSAARARARAASSGNWYQGTVPAPDDEVIKAAVRAPDIITAINGGEPCRAAAAFPIAPARSIPLVPSTGTAIAMMASTSFDLAIALIAVE